jgi:hypothetical protein
MTPLHRASFYGKLEAGQCLLDHGADINARDRDDWTPLRWAVTEKSNIQAVRFLLERGADVKTRSSFLFFFFGKRFILSTVNTEIYCVKRRDHVHPPARCIPPGLPRLADAPARIAVVEACAQTQELGPGLCTGLRRLSEKLVIVFRAYIRCTGAVGDSIPVPSCTR